MRLSVWKLKSPINSKREKRLLLLETMWKIVEELRRESCIRGYHIKRNMGPTYWRGGAVREGASLETRWIDIQLPSKRRSCCWTFSMKDIKTAFALFATRMYHRKIFVFLFFRFLEASENIFTPKISGFTVVHNNYSYIIIVIII